MRGEGRCPFPLLLPEQSGRGLQHLSSAVQTGIALIIERGGGMKYNMRHCTVGTFPELTVTVAKDLKTILISDDFKKGQK
jgi:hypothetical protein